MNQNGQNEGGGHPALSPALRIQAASWTGALLTRQHVTERSC